MPTCDLYGLKVENLESARIMIEQALGFHLAEHESLYLGGSYYRWGNLGQEHFILQRNIDPFDNEPAELEFPEITILLYVNETERPIELEQILTAKIPNIKLLRRKEC